MRVHRSRDRHEQAVSPDQAGERITAVPTDECRPRGHEVATTAAGHERFLDDPDAGVIAAAGRQARTATAIAGLEGVLELQADLGTARRVNEIAQTRAIATAQEHREAKQAHDDHRDRLSGADRFALIEDAPGWLVFVVLGLIAVGEWRLNRAPLELVGDTAFGTDLLAAVLGVGLVTAAHLAGLAMRRLLDRRPDWSSRVVSWHYVTLLSTVVGMVMIALALHHLRAAYFAEVDVVAGHTPLAYAQGFLLWVAAMLSLAHDAPMQAEDRRLESAVRLAARDRDDAVDGLEAASRSVDRIAARLVTAHATLLGDVEIQDQHTLRQLLLFASGVQEGAGRPIALDGDVQEDLDTAGEWQTWIEDVPSPVATAAPLSPELRELLASARPGARDVPKTGASSGARTDAAGSATSPSPDPRSASRSSNGSKPDQEVRA